MKWVKRDADAHCLSLAQYPAMKDQLNSGPFDKILSWDSLRV